MAAACPVPATGASEELADNGTDSGADNGSSANSSDENSNDTGTTTESSSTTVSSTTVSAVGTNCTDCNVSTVSSTTDCNVMSAPKHGNLGDCDDVLSSNASCQPDCDHGYTASGRLECIGGSLSAVECLPDACTDVRAPDNGTLGDCPALLESAASCMPTCSDGFFLFANSSCHLGGFARGSCVATCPPGFQTDAGSCTPCPVGSYTADERMGNEPCEPCEQGYVTLGTGSVTLEDCVLQCPAHQCCMMPGSADCEAAAACNISAVGALPERPCEPCPPNAFKGELGHHACEPCPHGSNSSAEQPNCRCGEQYYANRATDGSLVSCLPCPDFSQAEGSEGATLSDCQCYDGYLRIPRNDTFFCRLPFPCDLDELVYTQMGLTFGAHSLQRGTCGTLENDSLPSKEACRLMCSGNTAPTEGRYSFFSAIDPTVQCDDGVITKNFADDTWCSTASWEIPPVVFLATVTLLAGVAGLAADLRQRRFEHNCIRGLSWPGGDRGELVQRYKAKAKAE